MEHQPASPAVRARHESERHRLPFGDTRDVADADRGFIAALEPAVVRAADGAVVWNNDSYAFLGQDDAPDTVHPALWRQSQLTARQGLYEVAEGLYQVRGLDLSNMSIIEGRTGIIVVDPLISTETAAAALALYRVHRGDRPVRAVIYTHSHVDHFGGVLGVTSQADVDAGTVQVLAPAGFTAHAVSENVYAGTAMSRRSAFMYGAALDRGPAGQVGSGLGQTVSTGQVGLIPPTVSITATGERHVLDGVELEFQMAPGSEAPAEMHFYLPQLRALCMAENATHTMHNLLTLRGALVRDPHAWAGYLTEALQRYGHRTDVVFASHHWPVWDGERVRGYLALQRDLYAYLHDQTLRLLNRGYTAAEAAEEFALPPALERAWHARGYYGSVSHNVKAVAQRYLGWFDGNPARLWPHPPQALARRYVAALGGAERVLELAQAAYDDGDYRWAATLLDHAVFVDEANPAVRALYADTLEQLAYGAENGTWRNYFLTGAAELGGASAGAPEGTASPTMLARLTPEQLLDGVAVMIDGPRAWDLDLAFVLELTDLERRILVTLRNGVLVYRDVEAGGDDGGENGEGDDGDGEDMPLTVRTTQPRLLGLLGGDAASPGLELAGDAGILQALLGVIDPGDPGFAIMTP